MNQFEQFARLHKEEKPLLLGNIWDVNSAKILETLGYKALGTSSGAVATSLGYADEEEIPFPELLYLASRIKTNTTVPLTVDIEGGYSRNAGEVARHIRELHKIGVAGVNLEDSVVKGSRELLPVGAFSDMIKSIKNELRKEAVQIFLNVRTDPYLLGLPSSLDETLKRIGPYEKAGADGIFVPGIVEEKDIKAVTKATSLPINVMCLPNLPAFNKLSEWGVKRISMGPFALNAVTAHLKKLAAAVQKDQTFKGLF